MHAAPFVEDFKEQQARLIASYHGIHDVNGIHRTQMDANSNREILNNADPKNPTEASIQNEATTLYSSDSKFPIPTSSPLFASSMSS